MRYYVIITASGVTVADTYAAASREADWHSGQSMLLMEHRPNGQTRTLIEIEVPQ